MDVVERAASGAFTARAAHDAARTHLEVAEFSLERIGAELRAALEPTGSAPRLQQAGGSPGDAIVVRLAA